MRAVLSAKRKDRQKKDDKSMDDEDYHHHHRVFSKTCAKIMQLQKKTNVEHKDNSTANSTVLPWTWRPP